jgi:heme A synthase
MIDFFLTAHVWWQYVVLLAVVVSLVFAFRSPMMDPTAESFYRLTAVAVDIQVALGIVVWASNSGWSLGFVQGWLHPILGLAALGVLHAFIGRARREHPEVANRTVRTGLLIVIALVVATIGIGEMA